MLFALKSTSYGHFLHGFSGMRIEILVSTVCIVGSYQVTVWSGTQLVHHPAINAFSSWL